MDLDALARAVESLTKSGFQDTAAEVFAEECLAELRRDYTVPPDVEYLVHYTTLDSLLSMLGVPRAADSAFQLSRDLETGNASSPGFLRVYDTFYSNDPNEGYFFVNSVEPEDPFRKAYKIIWDLFEQKSEMPAYLASLVCAKRLEDADDLVFWRTYGRNGTGCAVVFPAYSFRELDNLFFVRYGEDKVASCLSNLHKMLDVYSGVVGASSPRSTSSSRDIHARFSKALSPLARALSPLVYLHKSNDYDYEKEARIIVPFSDIKPNALFCQFSTPAVVPPRWRHFAQLPDLSITKLLVSNSTIILGPTVDSPENIKFVLQQLLDQVVPHCAKVKTSRISYRS